MIFFDFDRESEMMGFVGDGGDGDGDGCGRFRGPVRNVIVCGGR